jgi:hypothetical protein
MQKVFNLEEFTVVAENLGKELGLSPMKAVLTTTWPRWVEGEIVEDPELFCRLSKKVELSKSFEERCISPFVLHYDAGGLSKEQVEKAKDFFYEAGIWLVITCDDIWGNTWTVCP